MTNAIQHIGSDAKAKYNVVSTAIKENGVGTTLKSGANAVSKGLKSAWHSQPLLVGAAGVTAAYFAVNAYRGNHARKELARMENQQQDLGR